jgi:F-type H+-transporting ATPase subunit a
MKTRHNIQIFFGLLFIFLTVTGGRLKAEENKINVTEIISEHLADSYEWHITKWGDKEISIHLPIIVKSRTSGWHVFSSSQVSHSATYKGFHISHEGNYAGKLTEHNSTGEEVRLAIDISLTKNAVGLIMNCLLLLLIILPLARWYKRGEQQAPKGFKGAVELLITYVLDEIIKPCVGEEYRKYATFLLTVFFFIFISNLMGLMPFFPGGANITGNIAVTMFLALCTFVVVNISGTKEYWKEILWPAVPSWLKVPLPIMPLIELFGVFTKPFALMIRLFANIMAGHAVILGLVCVIFISVTMGTAINSGMSVVAVLFGIFMNFLELLVAFIQAYVFTLLSSVFINMARVKHHG